MLNRSLTYAVLLLAMVGGLWQCARIGEQLLAAKSSVVIPPAREILRVAEKPTRSNLSPPIRKIVQYRMPVLQVFSYVNGGPISPLEALQKAHIIHTTRYFAGMGTSVQSIEGMEGADSWLIFAVNDWLPDNPDSWIVRLGAIPVASVSDIDKISTFTRGTIGVISATGHRISRDQISAETVFASAPGQNKVRITWLRVGPRTVDQ